MSDTIKGLLALIAIIIILGIVGKVENEYTITATVTEISEDKAYTETEKGIEYCLEPNNDLKVGDKVKVTMFTNYTDNRKDDKVLKVKVVE